MNSDLLISLLVETNCLFLAGWVLVLAAAFVLSFPEKLWFAQPPKNLRVGCSQNLAAESNLRVSRRC